MKRTATALVLIAASMVCNPPGAATAQTDSSWDGMWKGYWAQRLPATIEVRGGRVVDYFVNEADVHIISSHVDGANLLLQVPRGSVTLTRTGPNSADALLVSAFSGRLHVGGLASGYGAASAGGTFTRQ
jgi:hypothetical protein